MIPFSGDEADWLMWSRKFLAMDNMKKYRNVISGLVVPPAENVVLRQNQAAQRNSREKNDEAYSDLIMA